MIMLHIFDLFSVQTVSLLTKSLVAVFLSLTLPIHPTLIFYYHMKYVRSFFRLYCG